MPGVHTCSHSHLRLADSGLPAWHYGHWEWQLQRQLVPGHRSTNLHTHTHISELKNINGPFNQTWSYSGQKIDRKGLHQHMKSVNSHSVLSCAQIRDETVWCPQRVHLPRTRSWPEHTNTLSWRSTYSTPSSRSPSASSLTAPLIRWPQAPMITQTAWPLWAHHPNRASVASLPLRLNRRITTAAKTWQCPFPTAPTRVSWQQILGVLNIYCWSCDVQLV